MPDEKLPQPPELPTPPPADLADGQRQFGSTQANPVNTLQTNPTQSAVSIDNGHAPQRIPYWLRQAERFLRVIVRMYLGLLVCCAPWYPAAWDNNPLFLSSPRLLAFVSHGAVRGIVSGIGLLNLWIALRDALHSSSDNGDR